MPNARRKNANIAEISERVSKMLEDFHAETGRKIFLELEPGTFLTANAASILATIQDVTIDVNKI